MTNVVVLRVPEHTMVSFGVVSPSSPAIAFVPSKSSAASFIDVPGGVILVCMTSAAESSNQPAPTPVLFAAPGDADPVVADPRRAGCARPR